MSKQWQILLFCVALSACAVAPPPAPDTADVIVYRSAAPIGTGVDTYLYDGNQLLGTLQRGHYLRLKLPPGPRVLKVLASQAGSVPYATTLSAGQTYYLMIYFRGLGVIGDFGLAPQDPASAGLAVKQLAETAAAGSHVN